MPNRSSILRTPSSTLSQAEHLRLPIHPLATVDILEMYPLTPTSRMVVSTLIAGQVANRAKMLPRHLNTIGGRTQVPLQFSNHRTLATMRPLHPHPSILPLVKVLVAGKTVRVRPSAARTVPILHSHRDLLRQTLRRDRVTTPPDLRPTSDPTIDTLLPRLQPHPLSPDQTEVPHPQVLP